MSNKPKPFLAPQREPDYPDWLEIRVFRFRVFPYSLIISVEPDALLVLAVAHARRRPGYWRDRIG